jgi:hypothetical protein
LPISDEVGFDESAGGECEPDGDAPPDPGVAQPLPTQAISNTTRSARATELENRGGTQINADTLRPAGNVSDPEPRVERVSPLLVSTVGPSAFIGVDLRLNCFFGLQ